MATPRRKDLIGTVFGRLTVIEFVRKNEFGHAMWKCACACGGEATISTSNLRNKKAPSCGCAKTKHGQSAGGDRTGAYRSWSGMIQRCTNPNVSEYQRYGARGVTVFGGWRGRGGFAAFYAHIGPRPSDRHSIDRIKGDKGYEPGNVRWATPAEQCRNLKSNVWCVVEGERLIVTDLARKYGINEKTLRNRLRKMSATEAVNFRRKGQEDVVQRRN